MKERLFILYVAKFLTGNIALLLLLPSHSRSLRRLELSSFRKEIIISLLTSSHKEWYLTAAEKVTFSKVN